MYIKKVNSLEQLCIIKDWLKARDLPESFAQELPNTGYMIYDVYKPIAAGFLRKCEGNYALADSAITDPNSSPELRDAAMELLTSHLIESAKELGFKRLIAFSVDKNTLSRAKRLGFEELPHTALAAPLRK